MASGMASSSAVQFIDVVRSLSSSFRHYDCTATVCVIQSLMIVKGAVHLSN